MLRAAVRVLPKEMYEADARLAKEVSENAERVRDDAAAEASRERFLERMSTLTVVDAHTAGLVAHFADDAAPAAASVAATDTAAVGDAKVSPAALAAFAVAVLPILRRYPDWDYSDGNAVRRAARRAQAVAVADPGQGQGQGHSQVSLPKLGDTPAASHAVAASQGGWPVRRTSTWTRRRRGTNTDELSNVPLNGINSRKDYRTMPLSEFASAPGLAVPLGSTNAATPAASRVASAGRAHHMWGDFEEEGGISPFDVGGVGGTAVKETFDPESVGLPKAFDARQAFPKCKHLLGTVRDQGKCGSCWAVSTVEVMNDRLCVSTDGVQSRELSPQYPLSCFSSGNGCDGGDVPETFDEALARGIPLGGILKESRKSCLPYEFKPCDHPCQVPGTMPEQCPEKCANGKDDMEMVYPKSGAYTCPAGDWACIAKEIHKYGSVAVTFGTVYADFYEYESGVYRVSDEDKATGQGLGNHATKLIGWGFDENTNDPYWLMMNSWRNWGDNGCGRVGVGEMGIEAGVSAIHM